MSLPRDGVGLSDLCAMNSQLKIQKRKAAQENPQPWPHRGASFEDFIRIGQNGLGDPLNAYPHSMELYDGRLYVGTSRANLCMLKISKIRTAIKYWPVECPDNLYDLDMR